MKVEELKDILAHLKKATGPDRELDARIWCAIEGYSPHRFGEESFMYTDGVAFFWAPLDVIGMLTASLDAADALRRRLLPDRLKAVHVLARRNAFVTLGDWRGEAPTEPLAILIALFKAIVAREEGR